MKRILLATAATLALAGCGSSTTATTATTPLPASPTGQASQTGQPSQASEPSAGLSTSTSTLGTIVVDTSGRTVYLYDADQQGATSSVCTGGCAGLWPAVPAGKVAAGVSGTVGSITGVDGTPQATLDGWPLYYYAQDTAAGDTAGQGVGGVWWVISPDGAKITDSGGAADSPSSASSVEPSGSGDDSGGHGGKGDYGY